MIRISPFTPLFFAPSNDISGVSSKYVQLFAPSDAIFIQVLTTENEVVSGTLVNKMDDEEVPLLFEAFDMESGTRVYNVLVQGLPIGYYSVKIGDEESEIFKITDDNRELAGTTLISYTMHSNKMRTDGVFWNGEQQFTFYWRAPGGFKDDDWSFAVNNEQFETHQGNIVELFAVESTQKSFTLGNSLGCPIWYAEHLNRLLCCSDVHFNGVRFVRKGNNVPEMTQEIAGKKSYIFKVALQGMIEGIDIDLPEGDSEGESEGGGVGYIYLIKANDYVTPTDENTFSALRILLEIEKMEEEIDKLYLSKVKDDTALGLITLMKGFIANGICKAKTGLEVGEVINTIAGGKGTIIDAVGNILSNSIALRSSLTIGKSGYVGGLIGFGGRIDENANAELESLVLRRFLEVPELRFNRTKVFVGNNWIAPGAGIFERVVPDTDENGNQLMTGTGWLKLEDGECGAIEVGDICMGIFHSLNASDNATADSEQKDGEDIVGFHFSGFYTCYFTITEIVGGDNKQFRYQMRPISDSWSIAIHPSEAMTFVCYGSFSNDERQSSMYISKSYIRSLVHQNTWEIKADNIGIQLADLRNLSINGHSMANHSAYLNNVYLTGIVKQINAAGHEIQVANDRGNHISGEHYDYYDRVSYDGALWLCIAENGTNTPPSKNDSAWLCQVPAAQSITSHSKWESSKTPYPASTFLKMCDTIFISKVETSEPPYAILKDEKGNYLVNESGGYILHSPLIVSADWEMMLDASGLVDGEDGDSIEVRYSSDKTNWHFPYRDGDKFMQQRIGSESAWSDIITFVGEDGAAGKDGQYTDYQFAVNSSLDVAPATGWQETPPTVGEGQYLWMRMRVVDPSNGVVSNWSVARLGGEEGTSVYKSTVFIRTNNTPGTPEGGSYASPKPTTTGWSDGIPDGEQILWASTRVFTHNGKLPQEDVWTTPRKMTDTADFDVEFSSVESPNPPTGHPNTNTQWSNESGIDTIWMATSQKKNGVWGEWKVSKIKGEKGDMGVSITTHGRWHSGMTVPAMGVVTMAGNSYIAKVETQKPPLFCLLDENGNYLVTENGGYLLNGEENEEYDLLTTSGKDGSDGKDYEWIYQLKATDDIPSRPNTAQKDDFVPSGWNDNPTGVSETLPYEFASFRTKKDGVWSEFSTPAIWAKFGKDGQNAVYADMSNEMDNVALSSDGKTTKAWELTTTVAMWNGQTKAELKSIAISQVSGVTSSYNLSTGVVTFKIASGVSIAEHNELSIVVTAHINGIDVVRTLTFTLAGVKAGANGKDAVLYDIVVSASHIVKQKDGSYSIANISAYRNKTIGSTTQKTTDGTLKYSIDGGAETTINNDAAIQSSSISKKIQFIFYDANGVVVDRESVPVVEDGKDGVNAIYADIDNEMDSVALNSDGKSTSATELSTTVSMWNGSTKATLKSISVSAVSGVTTSYTLSSGVVKFNIAKGTSIAEHSEFKITVVATINGVDESRTLTFTLAGVKAGAKGIDAVLYKIITSVNSIVKRKDGTYNAEGVSACRYKVVNGVTTVATNGTLKYLIDDNNESTHEAVIGNNVQIPSYTFVKKVRFTFYDDNGAILDRETVPMIMDGTDGKGFEMYGNWHSGLTIPARGVVQMGGGTYVAKKATTRPPLCCLLDEKGNYLVTEKGGYLLTGEINTEEYDVWAERGEDGKAGVDGAPGADGKPGAQGIPGMQGCILRYAEWQPNYEWRNDTNKTEEELKDITGGIRYLDCAFVRNDATSTGWDVYYATETHISTANNAPSTEGSKWKEFSMNVPAIFTNIILAKQAHIDLLQGNDIMAKKADGTVTAGMSGGSDGIRFWAGATQENKATAPFRVNEQGESWLTNAHVSGEVNATSGVFKDVQIDSGTIGGFTIEKGTLRTSTLGSGRIIIEPGINKFIRINDDELSPLFYARNDSGVIMQLNAYGDNATALELLSNSSGSGVALRSTGDAYLVGRYSSVPSVSPHEKIMIAGLSVSCKNGSSFTSPTNVSPSTAWVDFLIANGDITLPSAKNCAGKVLFVKAKGVISCQETNGGIVLADGTTIQVAKNRGNNAMIYISDGNSWYEFYCG